MPATHVQSKGATANNSTSVAVTLDAAATAGNILFCVVESNRAIASLVLPTGFTEIGAGGTLSGTTVGGVRIGYMEAAGGETSFTGQQTAGNSRMCIAVSEWSGMDTTTPIDVHEFGADTASLTSHSTPAKTNTNADALYLYLMALGPAADSSETWGGWSRGTGRVDLHTTAANNNTAFSLATEDVAFAASRTASQSWTNSHNTRGIVVIANAAAGGGGPQTVTPGLISQAGQTFAPTIAPGPVTVSPGAISQAGQVFAPTVSQAGGVQTVTAGFISQAGVVFVPSLTQQQTVSPGLITQAGATFSPTIFPGAVVVAPALISQAGAIFAPVVEIVVPEGTILIPLIDQTGVVFAPSLMFPRSMRDDVVGRARTQDIKGVAGSDVRGIARIRDVKGGA